jgi:hypothetical protein
VIEQHVPLKASTPGAHCIYQSIQFRQYTGTGTLALEV